MGRKRVIKPPEQRRQELLTAARELFIEQGYEATTMSSIAKRANVAQGTSYIYFPSKQEILRGIIQELLSALTEVIRSLAERTDLPAPAVLRQAMKDCFALVSRESRLIEAVYLKANYSLPAQLLEESAPSLLPVIASVIERGVREGSLKVSHPHVAADFLWTVGYRLFEMAAQKQFATGSVDVAPAIAALEEAYWEFVSQGLGMEPAAKG